MNGPLLAMRVPELNAIGPVLMGGALLADLGADVVGINRIGGPRPVPEIEPRLDFYNRAKRSVGLDLKRTADVLLEGLRPGGAERLGPGPRPCLAANPGLAYGRMTGWGQGGPLAPGHDKRIRRRAAESSVGTPVSGVPS